jgi:two-component system, NarL family, sensor histidine kinase DesK
MTRAALVLIHIPVIMFPAAYTLLNVANLATPYTDPVPPIGLCLVIGALQLRHSFAAARGERPPGGGWTYLAMFVPVYAPMLWFGYFNWATAPTVLVASAPMVLRGRARLAVPGGIALLSGTMAAIATRFSFPHTGAQTVFLFFNHLTFNLLIGLALYGAVRLVRLLDELHATRSELAEVAVSRERLRVSRDLHDLLGQSLSAISLKGDLAVRLLHINPSAARNEIEGLTAVARDAMRGVRAVAREEHTVSLRQEADGAAALLAAAGIEATIDVDPVDLPPPVEETFAWAIREGVANVLQHSAAGWCSIAASHRDGTFELRIVNDGVRAQGGEGRGLSGLATRAQSLSGTFTATSEGNRFTVLLEIPDRRAAR